MNALQIIKMGTSWTFLKTKRQNWMHGKASIDVNIIIQHLFRWQLLNGPFAALFQLLTLNLISKPD